MSCPIKNYTGKKFGTLLVISFSHIGEDGHANWNCKCDCGVEKTIRRDCLKRSRNLTCGDRTKHCSRQQNSHWRGYGDIGLTHFHRIKNEGIKRGIIFNLSIKYLWDLFLFQKGKCALTGLDLNFGKNKLDIQANASLDRIDSMKGYIEGNVQWVDKRINFMKQDYPQDEFIKLCKLVANRSS